MRIFKSPQYKDCRKGIGKHTYERRCTVHVDEQLDGAQQALERPFSEANCECVRLYGTRTLWLAHNHVDTQTTRRNTLKRKRGPAHNHVDAQTRRITLTRKGGRFAAPKDSTPSQGRGWVHVSPGCFVHPGTRAFWLGGGCKGGQLPEGRRA